MFYAISMTFIMRKMDWKVLFQCLVLRHWIYVTNYQVTSPFVTNVELAQ